MEWQYDASMSTIQLADVDFATHDVATALAAYQDALAIRQQLVAKDPTNRRWQRAVFYSLQDRERRARARTK